MGNQGNSFDWCRQITEWIQSGVIGEVYEVIVGQIVQFGLKD